MADSTITKTRYAAAKQSPQIQLPWWPSTMGRASVHSCMQKSHNTSVISTLSSLHPGLRMDG
jgi:hypothetical protein